MSEQTLPALLNAIRDDLKDMPGIRRLYDEVPDALNEYPALVVASLGFRSWLGSHSAENGNWVIHSEHDIRIEVHMPRKNLPQAHEKMTEFAEEVRDQVYIGFGTDKYAGTMVTTGNPKTTSGSSSSFECDIGPSRWGSDDTYAVLANFQVTTQREIAV